VSWKEIERDLRERFESAFTDWEWPNDRRIRVRLSADALAGVVRFLSDSGQTRFITATAVETSAGTVEIWYHFDFYQTPQTLSVGVAVAKNRPSLCSIVPIVKSAEWIEKEIAEMFGVQFEGHPSPGRLLLPEGWPKGVRPMRRT
jgi:NADH-quinone oxidoreductase subunit C